MPLMRANWGRCSEMVAITLIELTFFEMMLLTILLRRYLERMYADVSERYIAIKKWK